MAKKLKKMLNYWFNPENYSIIKSINGIIDTVNELIDGGGGGGGYTLPIATTETLGGVKVDGTTITANGDGVISAIGGGGSVETLNWTKVDRSATINILPTGLNKIFTILSADFGISGSHKGLMLESDYFVTSGGELAQNNSLSFSMTFTNGYSTSIGRVDATATSGSQFNRVRVYAVKNPITGLYQMGYSIVNETRQEMQGKQLVSDSEVNGLTYLIPNPIVPIKTDMEINGISISGIINTETGAFATQGGVTFSLYVAD